MIPRRLHRTNVLEPVVSPVSELPTIQKVHDDKPASRQIGISAFVGPNALTFLDFVQSIPIATPSHQLAHPTQIPSYMGLQAGHNRFQLAS
jgi:hypothetical protein